MKLRMNSKSHKASANLNRSDSSDDEVESDDSNIDNVLRIGAAVISEVFEDSSAGNSADALQRKRKLSSSASAETVGTVVAVQNRALTKKDLIFRILHADKDGDRPIHMAVIRENLKFVCLLCKSMLKMALSIDFTNHMRQTPLHLAIILDNLEITTLLLKYKCSLTLRDRSGSSSLHLAVRWGSSLPLLQLLLSHKDAPKILNARDYDGYAPMHYAVLTNNQKAVKSLSNAGAVLDIVDGKSGRTPLIQAVLDHNKEMVDLLLRCGSLQEQTDYSGRTAMDYASANKSILELLQNSRRNAMENTSSENSALRNSRKTTTKSAFSKKPALELLQNSRRNANVRTSSQKPDLQNICRTAMNRDTSEMPEDCRTSAAASEKWTSSCSEKG